MEILIEGIALLLDGEFEVVTGGRETPFVVELLLELDPILQSEVLCMQNLLCFLHHR